MSTFRATATVTWDFVTELPYEEALQQAKQQAASLIRTGKVQHCIQHYIQDLEAVAHLRLDKIKDRATRVQVGSFSTDEVLPFITKEDTRRIYTVDGKEYQVKMNSHRYFIFNQSLACAACGLAGTQMILEFGGHDKSPHFNLYAEEDGNLILMTKDHIIAKSVGGEDRHSNYQTMCILCNNLKGSCHLTLEGILRLRRIYDENKHKLTRSKLHQELEAARKALAREVVLPQPKAGVTAGTDLNIWRTGTGLVGKMAYDRCDGEHVACFAKGTKLEVVETNEQAVVRFSDVENFTIQPTLLNIPGPSPA